MPTTPPLTYVIVGMTLLSAWTSSAARAVMPRLDPSPVIPYSRDEVRQFQQITQGTGAFYAHHIFAVDEDGNALLPRISRTQKGSATQYRARWEKLAGEDTRGRKGAEEALKGRRMLYLYLEAMFAQIRAQRPKRVVIHVHGGLNNIDGAIAKAARLADYFETNQYAEDRDTYFIGLCWNSGLPTTYGQHLSSIRNGLRTSKLTGWLSAPAVLVEDVGGAASRLPMSLINFWAQDVYSIRPKMFPRYRLALEREEQLVERQKSGDQIKISVGEDRRSSAARAGDLFGWVVTEPVKIPSTFFLDLLGVEPWKNMLRRTRTMFERETDFLPPLPEETPKDKQDQLRDQLNRTGRLGATRLFCEYAQTQMEGDAWKPEVNLIGHSMGAIVACEILQRFHQFRIDNAVFMAAACSISDFKQKVVPYLEEQHLREQLRGLPSGTEKKTEFYNLCLHDAAENGEKNPGKADLSQRGSLLTWIDRMFEKPESENDRTLGRWTNALLATDDIPGNVMGQITMKSFGRDRTYQGENPPPFYSVAGAKPKKGKHAVEPKKHGGFAEFDEGAGREDSNIAFWRKKYWQPEGQKKVVLTAPKSHRRKRDLEQQRGN